MVMKLGCRLWLAMPGQIIGAGSQDAAHLANAQGVQGYDVVDSDGGVSSIF